MQIKNKIAGAFLAVFLFLQQNGWSQSVGINSTGSLPNASSLLDVDAAPGNNKGILIPRLALTQTSLAAPVTTPATSLLVYNTASVNDVTPGYYYWDGSKWVRMLDQAWMLTGNSGTTAGTNFLGTTDAKDLVFKTNATEWMRILSAGNIGMGTATPGAHLDVQDGLSGINSLNVSKNFNGLTNTNAAFVGGTDASFTNTGVYFLQKDNVSFSSAGTQLVNVVSNGNSQMVV
ncbi:MAG TPA: hypothetical protein VII99_14260, partial [Bacteroidia bacterium]